MKMLFTYTITFSCNSLLSSREKSSWKKHLIWHFPATQQVLLPPPSKNKKLATCKYSYGTLHVVVASKFATDDLKLGWLYEFFQERQCTSLAIARSFSFAQLDQQVGGRCGARLFAVLNLFIHNVTTRWISLDFSLWFLMETPRIFRCQTLEKYYLEMKNAYTKNITVDYNNITFRWSKIYLSKMNSNLKGFLKNIRQASLINHWQC